MDPDLVWIFKDFSEFSHSWHLGGSPQILVGEKGGFMGAVNFVPNTTLVSSMDGCFLKEPEATLPRSYRSTAFFIYSAYKIFLSVTRDSNTKDFCLRSCLPVNLSCLPVQQPNGLPPELWDFKYDNIIITSNPNHRNRYPGNDSFIYVALHHRRGDYVGHSELKVSSFILATLT